MNNLLVAATEAEIQPAISWCKEHVEQITTTSFKNGSANWDILITGVGGIATTYYLSQQLHTKNYQHIIQAGIAGSFGETLALGEVVIVEKEYFGDLGAEDNLDFRDIFDLNLSDKNSLPFQNKALVNPFLSHFPDLQLKKVTGISVNKVSGNQLTINQLIQYFHSDIESMEGAAFHYVCLQQHIPFLQLRSISNLVTVRDKSKWNIPLAIKNLNKQLLQYVVTLQ